jgi:hypothetical protein
MIAVSGLVFLLFVFLGFAYPKLMGWGVIFLVPFLGAGQFTLVPAASLPLTTYRVAFAISLGILLGGRDSIGAIKRVLKSRVIQILLLFLVLYSLSAVRDRLANTLFTYIPVLLFPVLIAAFMIKTKEDLELLVKALVFQSFLVNGFIMIEYSLGFNISVLLKSTNPNIDTTGLWVGEVAEGYRRSGYYRVSGVDGHPVFTGYRMAFLFPLIILYMKNNRIGGWIGAGIALLGVMFLQTRATILALGLSMIAIALFNKKKRLFLPIIVILAIVFLGIQIPFISEFLGNFWYASFEQLVEGIDNPHMAQRYYRIPYAFSLFLESPFIGYGSKEFALYNVMPANDNDLPAPILYTLAGGIFVGLAYVSIFIGMIGGAYRIGQKNLLEKENINYMMIAFMTGFFVLCINTAENHVISMLLLYTGLYSSNYLKERHK